MIVGTTIVIKNTLMFIIDPTNSTETNKPNFSYIKYNAFFAESIKSYPE